MFAKTQKMRRLLMIASIPVAMAVATVPAKAGTFVSASGGGTGFVILNQSNGNITYCPAVTVNGSVPSSVCGKIGTISATNLAGNGSVSILGNIALVVNTANGATAICSLNFNGGNGQPTGGCVYKNAY